MSATLTCAPSSPKRAQTAEPIPPPPPVTTTCLPFTPRMKLPVPCCDAPHGGHAARAPHIPARRAGCNCLFAGSGDRYPSCAMVRDGRAYLLKATDGTPPVGSALPRARPGQMQTRVLLIENRNAATLRTPGSAIPVLGVVVCGWDERGEADLLRHQLAPLRSALQQAAKDHALGPVAVLLRSYRPHDGQRMSGNSVSGASSAPMNLRGDLLSDPSAKRPR